MPNPNPRCSPIWDEQNPSRNFTVGGTSRRFGMENSPQNAAKPSPFPPGTAQHPLLREGENAAPPFQSRRRGREDVRAARRVTDVAGNVPLRLPSSSPEGCAGRPPDSTFSLRLSPWKNDSGSSVRRRSVRNSVPARCPAERRHRGGMVDMEEMIAPATSPRSQARQSGEGRSGRIFFDRKSRENRWIGSNGSKHREKIVGFRGVCWVQSGTGLTPKLS